MFLLTLNSIASSNIIALHWLVCWTDMLQNALHCCHPGGGEFVVANDLRDEDLCSAFSGAS